MRVVWLGWWVACSYGAGFVGSVRVVQEPGVPLFCSSANTSLQGSNYRLEDIGAPVREAADIALDHGTSKYANDESRSSSIIDLRDFKTIRIGVNYERIADILLQEFGIDLQANGMAGDRAAMG